MSGRPISPSEITALRLGTIPPTVFDAFNEAIAKHWDGRSSTFTQNEVLAIVIRRTGLRRHEVFAENYLDVEEVYRSAGWHVEYDKPAYNESYEAKFIFKAKGR